ncbi:MAG: alpha/beta hydrolase [Rhizobiaceae bacterium]|nr:alpha/beta hydrolase [Rhizobiaceae bacterium]
MIRPYIFSPLVIGLIGMLHLFDPSPSHAHDSVTQQSTAELPFITTRNRTGRSDPDDFFGDERGGEFSGWCHVRQISIPGLSSIAEAAPFRIPWEFMSVTGIREAPLENIYSALEPADTTRGPLIYTHGYNISFEKGCRRAVSLQYNANLKDGFLWFGWPSDGVLTNYMRDETDLFWSAPSLADVIADMSGRFAPKKVNVAGHSLGGRGVALALYIMAAQHPEVKLENVVLLAPDMDFETFNRILPTIRDLAARFTIYTSVDDRALDLSENLHGYPRLGQSGNRVETLQGVEVIDVSEFVIDSASGHLYHIYGKLVGNDLDQLLNQGLGAAERENLKQLGYNHWSLQEDDW